jgi:hypothetical protein
MSVDREATPSIALEPDRAEAIALMILAAIHRPYPSHVRHLLESDADARAPRELTPAFYGSFDWHSAVHGHWALVRLARTCPDAPWRARALAAVGESLTPERLAGELAYLNRASRRGFERPTGSRGCCSWPVSCASGPPPDAAAAEPAAWRSALAPLGAVAAERMSAWRVAAVARARRTPRADRVLARTHDRLGARLRRPSWSTDARRRPNDSSAPIESPRRLRAVGARTFLSPRSARPT